MSARILIADADDYALATYRDYLERHGFEVVTATTGLECVAGLRNGAPDLLILEPSIPWGGGDGILAVMHEESDIPLIPVIVLTFGRDRGVLYRLAPFAIDDYQIKPLSAKRLMQQIRLLLDRNRNTHDDRVCRFGQIVGDTCRGCR